MGTDVKQVKPEAFAFTDDAHKGQPNRNREEDSEMDFNQQPNHGERIMCSRGLAFILCTLLISSIAQAQYPDVESEPPDGELAVYLVSVDQAYGQNTVDFTLELNGIVYNDVGYYLTTVNPNHPKYGYYGSDNLYGTYFTIATDNVGEFGQWESVYRGDAVDADPGTCPGMIGWGDYKLHVQIDDRSEYLHINTLDGNWMESSYGNNNKVALAVSIVDVNGEPDIVMEVWDWDTQDWIEYADNDMFEISDLLGDQRNTSAIDALSGHDFTWPFATHAPLVLNTATVDHEITIEGALYVAEDKTLIFTDYDNVPSIVSCNNSIVVKGTLLSETDNTSDGYYCVLFVPENVTNPIRSWEGIKSETHDTTVVSINLERAWIANAYRGVESEIDSRVVLDHCGISSCEIGVHIVDTKLTMHGCLVEGCGDGLELLGRLHRWGASFVDDCDICYSHPYAGKGTGVGIILQPAIGALFVGSDMTPENQIVIRDCRINGNWSHGIRDIYSYHAAVGCDIFNNGYRWGADIKQEDKHTGIWAEHAVSLAHGCNLVSNGAYGVNVSSGHFWGAYRFLVNEGVEPYIETDVDGDNCYDDNYTNIGANHGAEVYCGQQGRDGSVPADVWLDYRNSIKNPRSSTITLSPKHFTAAGWSDIYAGRNYFSPYAADCYEAEQHSNVLIWDMITDPDEVRCGAETEGSGGGTVSVNTDIKRAMYKMLAGTHRDSSWYFVKGVLRDTLSEPEAGMASTVAEFCYRSLGIDDALDSLELYAFDSNLSGTNMGIKSLLRLGEVYGSMSDTLNMRRAADSLRSRQLEQAGFYDTLRYLLTEADIAYRIQADSGRAVAVLLEILEEFPHAGEVKGYLFEITLDTTFVTSEDTLDKRDVEHYAAPRDPGITVSVIPNPSDGNASILVNLSSDQYVRIALHDEIGRSVSQVFSGSARNGNSFYRLNMVNLPPGLYLCVVEGESGGVVAKVIKK